MNLESLRLVLGGVGLTIQVLAAIITFDLYLSSRRRHALIAVIALTIMIVRRVTALLIQLDVNVTPFLRDIDTLVLPLTISIIWCVVGLTSKRRVNNEPSNP